MRSYSFKFRITGIIMLTVLVSRIAYSQNIPTPTVSAPIPSAPAVVAPNVIAPPVIAPSVIAPNPYPISSPSNVVATDANGQSLTNLRTSNTILQVDEFKSLDISQYATPASTMPEKLKKLMQNNTLDNGEFSCDNPEHTKPILLKNLNQIDERYFEVTNNLDVNVGLFGISGKVGKKDKLIQANFWLFRDCDCQNGKSTRALVGMTMYIHLANLDIDLKTPDLMSISAAAQLNHATASYHIQLFGVTEAVDLAALPTAGNLNYENYTKIIAEWDNLKKSLKSDSKVDPVIVPDIIPIKLSY
jgi:hypothetical protein